MSTEPKRGTLAYTLATWIYLLHATGRVCADPALRQACTDLGTGIDLESLGEALVEQIQGRLKGRPPRMLSSWRQISSALRRS